MIELGLVIGIAAVLVGGAAIVSYVPWYYLFGGGWVMCAVGLVLAFPATAAYHLTLYRLLKRQGPIPAGFWIRPMSLHERLSPEERRRLRPWFFVGGAGFGLALLGCIAVALGAWRS